MEEIILETRNLTKIYASVKAVSSIDFSIKKGELRAIIGANGAGKSTFVKILYGEVMPDDGLIYLNGKPTKFSSPKDALLNGVSMVPQDFGLIESMSVAENISLMANIKNYIIYNKSTSNQLTDKLLKSLAIFVDPNKKVKELSVSEKQLISIAKALNTKSDILIFDEPTSVLNANSFSLIKNLLEDLKQSGKSIIYVTHKLDEVFEIADSVSVFLDSKIVFTSDIKGLNKEDLLKYFHIISSPAKVEKIKEAPTPLLVIDNLATQDLDNISFTVNTGESIGVISDNYIESVDLVKSIFGAVNKKSGTVKLNNNPLNTPYNSIKNKVGFIPEDRRNDGVFNSLNIFENISILNFKKTSRFGFISKDILIQNAKNKIEKLKIKCQSIYQSITELSGGNQQKTLFARWMSYDFDLLILLEPTAGIDLGGKSEIHSIILELKKNRKSFLIVSSDIQELKIICDKILLIKNGKFEKLIAASEYFQQD